MNYAPNWHDSCGNSGAAGADPYNYSHDFPFMKKCGINAIATYSTCGSDFAAGESCAVPTGCPTKMAPLATWLTAAIDSGLFVFLAGEGLPQGAWDGLVHEGYVESYRKLAERAIGHPAVAGVIQGTETNLWTSGGSTEQKWATFNAANKAMYEVTLKQLLGLEPGDPRAPGVAGCGRLFTTRILGGAWTIGAGASQMVGSPPEPGPLNWHYWQQYSKSGENYANVVGFDQYGGAPVTQKLVCQLTDVGCSVPVILFEDGFSCVGAGQRTKPLGGAAPGPCPAIYDALWGDPSSSVRAIKDSEFVQGYFNFEFLNEPWKSETKGELSHEGSFGIAYRECQGTTCRPDETTGVFKEKLYKAGDPDSTWCKLAGEYYVKNRQEQCGVYTGWGP